MAHPLPTVLVVEDDPLLLIDARFVLESAGFAVVEAVSADAAFELLDGGLRVTGVMSDVRMPGAADGVALARKLRHERPDVHIVLTTGAPEEVDLPEGVTLVAKPYRPNDLTRPLGLCAVPVPEQAAI